MFFYTKNSLKEILFYHETMANLIVRTFYIGSKTMYEVWWPQCSADTFDRKARHLPSYQRPNIRFHLGRWKKKNSTEERRRRKRADEEFKHGGRGHVSAQPRIHREEWGYSRSSGCLYEGLIAWDTAPLPPGAAQHSVAALLSFCRAWRAGWMRREGGRTREGGGPGG